MLAVQTSVTRYAGIEHPTVKDESVAASQAALVPGKPDVPAAGGVEDMRVTTRILCATNANLQERVAAKEFRKDLYFRINVVNIYMPALREMGEDVANIAQAIVHEFNRELKRNIEGFTPAAERRLQEHNWPGNVRELRNVLERAMIFTQGSFIDVNNLAISSGDEMRAPAIDDGTFRFELGESLEDLEKAYILETLKTMDASYAEISDRLGISKKTLWEKRKRYNLDDQLDR
jgi:DNA-binding NtrC family response regulator